MTHLRRDFLAVLAVACLFSFRLPLAADEVDEQLKTISRVGLQGQGSAEARLARDRLTKRGPAILPRLLAAMDSKNVIAGNWYRTVYEEIIARELARSRPQLPTEFFKKYVNDAKRPGRVRRLLLELLDRIEPKYSAGFLPGQLGDPEFRQEAVDLALARGDAARKNDRLAEAAEAYDLAFRSARDSAQLTRAALSLRQVGREVSVVDQMGFLIDWYLIGPFDAPGFSGLETSFPPETRINLTASYTGKGGGTIVWERHQSSDLLGQLNLIQAIAAVKEAVGYAYTVVESPRDQAVELRCGADDNCTVWLNGEKIFARGQWLNGTRLDRFTAPARLRNGKNTVLVKICQGPQHKNPAVPNNWSLQLRFCDAEGASVGLKSALPPTDGEKATSQR